MPKRLCWPTTWVPQPVSTADCATIASGETRSFAAVDGAASIMAATHSALRCMSGSDQVRSSFQVMVRLSEMKVCLEQHAADRGQRAGHKADSGPDRSFQAAQLVP